MLDLYSGEDIKAKTKKDRELMLFQNRVNMNRYFKENPDKTKEICIKLLKNRKAQKDLIYAPSLVELKSSVLPTIGFLKDNGLDYRAICDELGFISRYDYSTLLSFDNSPIEFWIDTREQKPLKLNNSKVVSLAFGDYISPSNPNIAIERKSINDLVSTISQGYDRLQEEIKRAAENDVYVVMLVEVMINKALSFNYLPQMRWAKATPEFIFSRIRDLLQNYNNFQIGFCDGRVDMSVTMNRIYNFNGDIKKLDVQWAIEEKLI